MSAHLRFRVGPVVIAKRLEASAEMRSIVPVLVGAALVFLVMAAVMAWQS